MPLYASLPIGPCLQDPGDSFLLFSAESPVAGQLSQQVFIQRLPFEGGKAVSVELLFSGDPGAFQFQVQDADTDQRDAYVNVPTAGLLQNPAGGPGPAGRFVIKTELSPFAGNFLLLKCVQATANAVTVTAKVTKQ